MNKLIIGSRRKLVVENVWLENDFTEGGRAIETTSGYCTMNAD